MAEIIQMYNTKTAYSKILESIKTNNEYTEEEKAMLLKMVNEMEAIDVFLNAIEIIQEDIFDFEIKDFEKYRNYLIKETYKEIINELLCRYKDYEDVSYFDIRRWFDGMTINIELLNKLDTLFKENNIEIKY